MTSDETGWAEVPGTEQAHRRGLGSACWRPMLSSEVGGEAHTEMPPFSCPDLSQDPNVSTASDWQG